MSIGSGQSHVQITGMESRWDGMLLDQLLRTATMIGMPVCMKDQGEIGQLKSLPTKGFYDPLPFARTARIDQDIDCSFDQIGIGNSEWDTMYTGHFVDLGFLEAARISS